MADLTIKPQAGSGNKLIIQDQAGNARVTTSDAGIDIPAVTGNLTVAGQIIPSSPLSHRNMIINGGMQVAQRGTVTDSTSRYAGPDRYTSFIAAAGTWEHSQHDMTSAELNTTGFSNAYKMKCTVANASIGATGYAILGQRLEAQNLQHLKWGTASAKDMTLSFWVKSSKTGTHVIQLFHDESTGYNSIAYTIAVANTWEYKTMTFSGHPSIAINNDNGSGFRIYFWLDAGSNYKSGTLTNNTWHTTVANRAVGQVTLADTVNNEFYLTGVQLELGSNATPFEHRSYGEELARCQRYFYNIFHGTTSNLYFASHHHSGAGNVGWQVFNVPFPVPMRTLATLTHSMTNAKHAGSQQPGAGTDTWTYYVQNQGYSSVHGNGNASNLGGSGIDKASIGTYYMSPSNTNASHLVIGSGTTFTFSAEL